VREWAGIPMGKWAGKKVGKEHASRKEGGGETASVWASRQRSGHAGKRVNGQAGR
jgi:hypothetical protein